MPNPVSSDALFAFVCCAYGAEVAVKAEVATDGWRLAFSRPGFISLKRDSPAPARVHDLPEGVFVRTASHSIARVRAAVQENKSNAEEMIRSLQTQLDSSRYAQRPFDQLHVWPKDRAPIGKFDFEPGVDELSRVVASELLSALGDRFLKGHTANQVAEAGDRVLDVVLIEPSHWFVGMHTATTWSTRWPGGVQPLEPLEPPVSRAYFKAAESILWSGFKMRPGDLAIEIGSAPGGVCQRLLEMGLNVIGIDPAEMDERVTSHPRFEHWRVRAGDLPRREFRGAKWLFVDSNVRPAQTLQTVQNIVTNHHSELEGLLITLKIGEYTSAGMIDTWRETIQSWSVASLRVRQLARNRREVCFAVEIESKK